MKIRSSREAVIVGAVAFTLSWSWITAALAQAPPGSFANVVIAARAAPGCLGVETGQTASGKRIIFAWFENKKALVAWYHSDTHQKAMKTVFPRQTFDRQPLPDLPEDSGPILAIVSVKFLDAPRPDATSRPRHDALPPSATVPCRAGWRWADGSPPMHSRCVDCERSTSGRRKVSLADGTATSTCRAQSLTRLLAGRYHARTLRSVSLAGGSCGRSIGALASGSGPRGLSDPGRSSPPCLTSV